MHENAREAKTKLQQYKAKVVQEMVEESRELMRQALEEVAQYNTILYSATPYTTIFTVQYNIQCNIAHYNIH